jgi:hypothetical protein
MAEQPSTHVSMEALPRSSTSLRGASLSPPGLQTGRISILGQIIVFMTPKVCSVGVHGFEKDDY